MWTKPEEVASGRYSITKRVIDWAAVFATIFWIVVIVALII